MNENRKKKPTITPLVKAIKSVLNTAPANAPVGFAPAPGSALWRELEENEIPLAGDEAWNGELRRWETVSFPSMWLAGGQRIAGDKFRTRRAPNDLKLSDAECAAPKAAPQPTCRAWSVRCSAWLGMAVKFIIAPRTASLEKLDLGYPVGSKVDPVVQECWHRYLQTRPQSNRNVGSGDGKTNPN